MSEYVQVGGPHAGLPIVQRCVFVTRPPGEGWPERGGLAIPPEAEEGIREEEDRRAQEEWRASYRAAAIALGLAMRDGPDSHAVDWGGDAGRVMDEIDAIIDGAA